MSNNKPVMTKSPRSVVDSIVSLAASRVLVVLLRELRAVVEAHPEVVGYSPNPYGDSFLLDRMDVKYAESFTGRVRRETWDGDDEDQPQAIRDYIAFQIEVDQHGGDVYQYMFGVPKEHWFKPGEGEEVTGLSRAFILGPHLFDYIDLDDTWVNP